MLNFKQSLMLALVAMLGCSVSYAQSDYQKYLNYVHTQGGPYINPTTFSASHTLDKAPAYARQLCNTPGFHCIETSSTDTWEKLFPDYSAREAVMRLNRTNVSLAYRSWLVVPDKKSDIDYMAFAPFPKEIAPPNHKLLLIDLHKFAFAAYNKDGALVYWGPATGGKKWCSANHKRSCLSALGHYKIYRIQGADCVSSEYPIETHGGAPMPYCMHYHMGFAIHGSTLSGFENRSQGCIRLFYDDAKWLNHQFVKIGTHVIVKS